MKRILIATVLGGFLALGAGCQQQQPPQFPGATSQQIPSTEITDAKYNKIKNGMTLKEVEKIMGSPGTKTSSMAGDTEIVGYAWQDTQTFETISIVLDENGKVEGKAKI